MSGVQGEKMDRGTEAMKSHLAGCSKMEIRQTRRGFCQECMGCEAKTEFKYFIDGQQIGHSVEDTDCFCRMCCSACHPFKMNVKELNTEAPIVLRFDCCGWGYLFVELESIFRAATRYSHSFWLPTKLLLLVHFYRSWIVP